MNNLTPAEQELWTHFYDLYRFRGYTDGISTESADKLLAKSRECTERVCQENQKLEACCAEMRKLIEDFKPICAEDVEDMERINRALSSDCGKGWKSPEEWEKLQETLRAQVHHGNAMANQTLDDTRKIAELESLLQETTKFHLREEDHREWLERRDKALK